MALVATAKARGVNAVYGPHVGMGGWQDRNIVRKAIESDYMVVTNNRRDFLREYAKYDSHSGLAIIVPNVERAGQIALFSRALDKLMDFETTVENKLVEVLAGGTIHVRTGARADHDTGHVQDPKWS